jgi:hypothetical protein
MAVNPMHHANAAPRCGAKSKRSGFSCQAPAVRGKRVCRMHACKRRRASRRCSWQFSAWSLTCDAVDNRKSLARLIAETRRTVASLA